MKNFGTFTFTPLSDKEFKVNFEEGEGMQDIKLREISEANKAVTMVLETITSSRHQPRDCSPDNEYDAIIDAEVVPYLSKALVALDRYSVLLAENRI